MCHTIEIEFKYRLLLNSFVHIFIIKGVVSIKKSLGLLLASSMLLIGVNSVCAEEIKGIDIKNVFTSDKASGNIITVQPGVTLPSAGATPMLAWGAVSVSQPAFG